MQKMMLLLKENRIIEMISVLIVENQVSNLVLKTSKRDITYRNKQFGI